VTARPCRPCDVYAVQAAQYGLPLHKVQPARFRATWPPRGFWYDQLFDRCQKVTLWVCAKHARVALWPIGLTVALWAETEDLTMPAIPPLSALDDLLRAKAAGRVPKTKRMYGAWPGEDRAAVLAAFREAGTYAAAGRLLDERHVPSRGGRPWQPQSVAWIVELAALGGL
jgi:hypothetical protein